MSLLDNISKITQDNGQVYLKCCPISDNVPVDQPNVKKINTSFYSCKVILVRDKEEYDLTDWFSVPRSNLNNVLHVNTILGDAVILIDRMNSCEKEQILEDTCAVFSINNDINNNVLKWLDDN